VVSGLLAFMAVTGYAGMLNLQGVAPELIPPPELFAGSPASFRLRLHNRKRRLPSFLLRVECTDGEGALLPVVPPASVADAPLQLTFPRRGRTGVGEVRISSPFPVNFFTRFWTFRFDTHLIVYPRLIPAYLAGEPATARQAGTALRRERGLDGELERIAAYSGREPLRAIHWKLSARGEGLLVKEFGRQSAPPLVINPEELSGATLEERLSRAAWLVRRSVQERPVGLRLGGTVIPPGSGRAHGMLLLKELALHGID